MGWCDVSLHILNRSQYHINYVITPNDQKGTKLWLQTRMYLIGGNPRLSGLENAQPSKEFLRDNVVLIGYHWLANENMYRNWNNSRSSDWADVSMIVSVTVWEPIELQSYKSNLSTYPFSYSRAKISITPTLFMAAV